MAVRTRSSIVSNAIEDWQSRGLITPETAAVLLEDAHTASSGFAFRNILILLAIVCLGFAAMTFVAANWEDMARLTRVILVFAAMWGFWGGAAFFHVKGQNWFAQVFTLGACAMFGAGIMLISQIYHIQGSPKDATWLWAMGTLLAAGVTRSTPALCFTIALLVVWVFIDPNMFGRGFDAAGFQLSFLAYLAICAGLAYWMQSRFAAHLTVLAFSAWAVTTAIALLEDQSLWFFGSLLGLGFGTLSLMLFSDRSHNWLRGFERATSAYSLVTIGILVTTWHFVADSELRPEALGSILQQIGPIALVTCALTAVLALAAWRSDHPNLYDLAVCTGFAAVTFGIVLALPGAPFVTEALMLASSIWIIRMGWRIEYRPIAVLGFIAFGLVMLLIYFETVGSLLGTSVFYLVAGLLLLAGVFLIPRLTRTTGDSQ